MIRLEQRLKSAMEAVRKAYDEASAVMDQMKALMDASPLADQDELCFHELWVRSVRELLDELDKRGGHLKTLNSKRFAVLLLNSEDFTVRAYGRRFRLDADMWPVGYSDKREELARWLIERGYGALVTRTQDASAAADIDAKGLKTLIERLAEQGQPGPPMVSLAPQFKVVVTKEPT